MSELQLNTRECPTTEHKTDSNTSTPTTKSCQESFSSTTAGKKRSDSVHSDKNRHWSIKKRTPQACERCRIKKAKCSGGTVCEKCSRDGTVCVTRPPPQKANHIQRSNYLLMVEAQRDQIVQAVAKYLKDEDPLISAPLKSLLVDMGIDIYNLPERQENEADGSLLRELPNCRASSLDWAEAYFDLTAEQMGAMEQISQTSSFPDALHPPPIDECSLYMYTASPEAQDHDSLPGSTSNYSDMVESIMIP